MRYSVIWNAGKDHGCLTCKSYDFAVQWFEDFRDYVHIHGHLLCGKTFTMSLYDNTERLRYVELY